MHFFLKYQFNQLAWYIPNIINTNNINGGLGVYEQSGIILIGRDIETLDNISFSMYDWSQSEVHDILLSREMKTTYPILLLEMKLFN